MSRIRFRSQESYFGKLITSGNATSSMRWLMIINFILTSTLVWGVWMIMCVKNSQIADIPMGVLYTYLGINGVTVGGKAFQSIFEPGRVSRENEDMQRDG